MGKGSYGSDKSNESIMYWTTDAGFDVDISPFIKSEKKEKTEHGWYSYVWRATVTFGNYSYELATSSFNMNILADDIKKHLLEQNLPDFTYKLESFILTRQYYEETRGKFSTMLDRKETLYNPVKDTYYTKYLLRNEKYQTEAEFTYIHKGSPDYYVRGDFTKEVLKHCKSDMYVVSETVLEKISKRVLKKVFPNPKVRKRTTKTYYKVSENILVQKIEVNGKLCQFVHDGNPNDDRLETNLEKYLHYKFPEYIL